MAKKTYTINLTNFEIETLFSFMFDGVHGEKAKQPCRHAIVPWNGHREKTFLRIRKKFEDEIGDTIID